MGANLDDNEKSPSSTKKPKQGTKKNFTKEASPKTAHDWRKYKTKEVAESDGISPVEVEFYDDGTVTFFWFALYLIAYNYFLTN